MPRGGGTLASVRGFSRGREQRRTNLREQELEHQQRLVHVAPLPPLLLQPELKDRLRS